jgi:hypothetical protein
MDTNIIAIYEAALSTVITLTGVLRWWYNRRPQVKTTFMLATVELATEHPPRAVILDGRPGKPAPRDVILGGVGLLLPTGKHLPLVPATTTGPIPIACLPL